MTPSAQAREIVLSQALPVIPVDRDSFDLYRAHVVRAVAAALAERDREIERLKVAEGKYQTLSLCDEHDKEVAGKPYQCPLCALRAQRDALVEALESHAETEFHDGLCFAHGGECHPIQSGPATFPKHSARCLKSRAALAAGKGEKG